LTQLWRFDPNGLLVYRFAALERFPGLVHGVTTRLGGVSAPPFASLNLSFAVGDDPGAVRCNRQRLAETLGVPVQATVTAHQVHGTTVRLVTATEAGAGALDPATSLPASDALITTTPGLYLTQRYADCLPMLFYDPRRRAAGLAHAGWRGTLAGIAGKTVMAMIAAFQTHPADLWVGLGPAIGPCCYEVGADVIAAAAAAGQSAALRPQGNGRVHFDLWAANRDQLRAAGVPDTQILDSHLCTACHTNAFYSHRAEGGRTGRFGALLGIRS